MKVIYQDKCCIGFETREMAVMVAEEQTENDYFEK
jgi:hypothetical protein